MRFRVDRQDHGIWTLVATEIEASGAHQAVTRAASGAGLYRANPFGTSGLDEAFDVPDWGSPTRVPEP